jgi:hypothetical protein
MVVTLIHNVWFVQILGAIALLFGVIAWNSDTRAKILRFQSINSALFAIHYLLLGALSGALMSVIILIRNFVFAQQKKHAWARYNAWIYFFMILSVTTVGFFWQGWPSILPVCGVIIGTYAVSRKKPKDIRYYVFITLLFWAPYTLLVHSYSGLASQIITGVGILIGMSRLDREVD